MAVPDTAAWRHSCGMIECRKPVVRVLDPAPAWVAFRCVRCRMCRGRVARRHRLTAYETDPMLIGYLQATLIVPDGERGRGIRFEEGSSRDFLEAGAALWPAISFPPEMNVRLRHPQPAVSEDPDRIPRAQVLRAIGIRQATCTRLPGGDGKALVSGGEMVAITPRASATGRISSPFGDSFCGRCVSAGPRV